MVLKSLNSNTFFPQLQQTTSTSVRNVFLSERENFGLVTFIEFRINAAVAADPIRVSCFYISLRRFNLPIKRER